VLLHTVIFQDDETDFQSFLTKFLSISGALIIAKSGIFGHTL